MREKLTLQSDSEHYIVTESDGIAVVKVRLISGSLSIPITVRLTTEDGSAIGVCIDSLTILLSSKCFWSILPV